MFPPDNFLFAGYGPNGPGIKEVFAEQKSG
jgi:hypothetical protein